MAGENVPLGASPVQLVTRAEAKARGLKRFFTGEPCKHGHIAERAAVNGRCFACRLRPERTGTRAAQGVQINKGDAASLGFTYYFTGKPCTRGHIAERVVTSGQCVVCRKHLRRMPVKKHARRPRGAAPLPRAELLAHRTKVKKQWEAALPPERAADVKARRKERASEYYQENKERAKNVADAWRGRNRERVNEKARERYRNGGRALATHHARRARIRNAPQGDAAQVRAFFRWVKTAERVPCYWCKRSNIPKTQRSVDHVIPLIRGGVHAVANFCACCLRCNKRKTALMPQDFAATGQSEIEFAA